VASGRGAPALRPVIPRRLAGEHRGLVLFVTASAQRYRRHDPSLVCCAGRAPG
jgi:hypothetical protein